MKAPIVIGKAIPILVLVLILGLAHARVPGQGASNPAKGSQSSVEGTVLPDNLHDRQPFSFAAPQAAEGTVVSVSSLDGVVVDSHAADKYGRVFLAAGLPAGLRFLTLPGMGALLDFPPDMARVPAEANRLSNQVLVHTFEDEWGQVHQ